jgi:hypothetical protein
MQLGTVTIARRFRGPPYSGNGGYSCGRLAAFIDGPAEVTLRKPPPLEFEMKVVPEDGGVAMYAGDQLIASARPVEPWTFGTTAPAFEEALAATGRTFDASVHKLPMCYVCGPDRAPGDGLRIFCGPVDPADTSWSGTVAAPWVPELYMTDVDGRVSSEYVWAALDCPTAYASGSPAGFPTILLGRQSVSILDRPTAGENCIIAAHQTGRDGRKYLAEASLFNEAGTALAYCRATWIEVAPDVQRGSG